MLEANVPLGHSEHAVDPAAAVNSPGLQGEQLAAPDAEAVPAEQGEQFAAPALELVPALQVSQPTAPTTSLALPSSQRVHSAEPGTFE